MLRQIQYPQYVRQMEKLPHCCVKMVVRVKMVEVGFVVYVEKSPPH